MHRELEHALLPGVRMQDVGRVEGCTRDLRTEFQTEQNVFGNNQNCKSGKLNIRIIDKEENMKKSKYLEAS